MPKQRKEFRHLSHNRKIATEKRIAAVERHWKLKLPQVIDSDIRPPEPDPREWSSGLHDELEMLAEATVDNVAQANALLSTLR